MRIELKNVRYAAFASQETACFSATVYVDGVKEGTVENSGTGGADIMHPWQLEKKIEAFLATQPLVTYEVDGKEVKVPQSVEGYIGKLLDDHLEKKTLKRLCAKQTVFRIAGQTYADGEYTVIKKPFEPGLRSRVVAKYGPDVKFLNESM